MQDPVSSSSAALMSSSASGSRGQPVRMPSTQQLSSVVCFLFLFCLQSAGSSDNVFQSPFQCLLGCFSDQDAGAAIPSEKWVYVGVGSEFEQTWVPQDLLLDPASIPGLSERLVAEMVPFPFLYPSSQNSVGSFPRLHTLGFSISPDKSITAQLRVDSAGRHEVSLGYTEPGGLLGAYFDNSWFQGDAREMRTDSILDFSWGAGAVLPDATDHVAVRWCGYISPVDFTAVGIEEGAAVELDYELRIEMDNPNDAAQLWVNGSLIVDLWDRALKRHGSVGAKVRLRTGTLSSVMILYRHLQGDASVRLLWSNPLMSMHPIPSEHLHRCHPGGKSTVVVAGSGAIAAASGEVEVGGGSSVVTAGDPQFLRTSPRDVFGNQGLLRADSELIAAFVREDSAPHILDDGLLSAAVVLKDAGAGKFEGILSQEKAGTGTVEVSLSAVGGLAATYYNEYSLLLADAVSSGEWIGSVVQNASALLDNVTSKAYTEGFAVRWAGFLGGTNSSEYGIKAELTTSSERVRVWLDSQLIIDQWTSLASDIARGAFTPRTSDGFYPIRIDYHQGVATGTQPSSPGLTLSWESPAGTGSALPNEVIPSHNLYFKSIIATKPLAVVPAQPDAGASTVSALSVATSGTQQTASVWMRDRFGNAYPQVEEDDICEGAGSSLTGILRQDGLRLDILIRENSARTDQGDPTHTAVFTPLLSGNSAADFTLNGLHLQGSPVYLQVLPGVLSRSNTVARGMSLTLSTAGVGSSFTIIARDEEDNLGKLPSLSGLEVDIADSNVVVNVEAVDESRAETSFLLSQSGVFELSVKWSGKHIAGSPFSLRVLSAETCSATSSARGSGLSLSTVGKMASFTISSRDQFSNPSVDLDTHFVTRLYPSSDSSARPVFLQSSADFAAEVPTAYSFTQAGSFSLFVKLAREGGLAATYFSTTSLDSAFATESEIFLSGLNWTGTAGSSLPIYDNATGSVQYGARWAGLIDVKASDSTIFTFSTTLTSDTERVKLWVDNQLLVNQWSSLQGLQKSGTVSFVTGTGFYEIEIEYHDIQTTRTNVRGVSLFWNTDGDADGSNAIAFGIIPVSRLLSAQVILSSDFISEATAATGSKSTVIGDGLTLLTAGVTSLVTVTLRDEFENVVSGDAGWVFGAGESPTTFGAGRTASVYSTAAGTYAHAIKVIREGGLHATYYADTSFSTPLANGQSLGALGAVDTEFLLAAISEQDQYFSVRWSGFLRPSQAGSYTFFSDTSRAVRLDIEGSEVFDCNPADNTDCYGVVDLNAPSTQEAGKTLLLEWRQSNGVVPEDVGVFWSRNGGQRFAVTNVFLEYGQHISSSPFSATVVHAPACASTAVVTGPGLSVVTVAAVNIFFIQVKDEFSNDVSNLFTTCTTSATCESGTTLGIDVHYVPDTAGVKSVRCVDSFSGNGAWDILVLGITVSGSYQTVISFPIVGGLVSTYYSGDPSTEPDATAKISRTDGNIQVNSSVPSSFPSCLSTSESFSARWSGLMIVPCPLTTCTAASIGDYRFQFEVGSPGDRVRLWLDDFMVIDQWTSLSTLTPEGTFQISGVDQMVRTRAWYKRPASNASATASLSWAGDGDNFTLIPSLSLFEAFPVADSPYPAFVFPTALAGSQATATVPSLATAGVPLQSTITARDRFSNPRDFDDTFLFRSTLGTEPAKFTLAESYTDESTGLLGGLVSTILTRSANYSLSLFFVTLGGLTATYYQDPDFLDPTRAVRVTQVDLCPTSGCASRPTSSALTRNAPFATSFGGMIQPTLAQNYTFTVT
eukprot:674693-Rhodomonas_salina.1